MKTLQIHYDYASPFAYLATEVLPGFAQRVGVALEWRPLDLARLGNYEHGLPYSPLKRRYVVIDAARSAQFHGVAMQIPKPHPVESVPALQLAAVTLGEPAFFELHRALFRAAWRDQRDISQEDVLADCIAQAKGPVEKWLRASQTAQAAARVEALSAEAESHGIFGVPSLLLDGELFWGLDSLPTLEWRLQHPVTDA